jgi:enolase
MATIKSVKARQILDSRGNPTVEVDVTLDNGIVGSAAVPSGASTGEFEACELRDGGDAYLGKGVLTAVKNANTKINRALKGMNPTQQAKIDQVMIDLDGTPNKNKLGANAILGTSMAVARAAAQVKKQPLYKYIASLHKNKAMVQPLPMCNIVNGGEHSSAPIDIQEFMIAPVGAKSFEEGLQMVTEIFHALKKVLEKNGYDTTVGDEGGYAPAVKNQDEVFRHIKTATKNAGYKWGDDIQVALDVASSELYNKETGKYTFKKSSGRSLTADQMIAYYDKLCTKYPIYSIEDGLDENDWDGWKAMTKVLGKKVQLVGDDFFVTNPERLAKGIKSKSANAILIKVNQIGTVSETLEAIAMAQKAKYGVVSSHRSGETADTFISDLAVGTGAGQIKTGSLSRTDRVAKYNQLIRIGEQLKAKAQWPGKKFAVKFGTATKKKAAKKK